MRRCFFFIGVIGLFASTNSHSIEHHSFKDIHRVVKHEVNGYLVSIYGSEKVEQDIEIHLSNLDSRLTLPKCEDALEVNISETTYGKRSLTVKVQCPSNARWSIFVPTKVDIFEDVAISTRNLQRGEKIRKSDFVLRRTNTSSIARNYLDSNQAVLNKQIKRPIRAGSVIKSQDIQEANVINKGDTVVVLARTGALQVSSEGTALADGTLGEQIRIKNQHSSRIVDALVTGPGQAEVQMWQ